MKKLMFMGFIGLGLSLVSCSEEKKTDTKEMESPKTQTKIENVHLDSDKDPVCQMGINGEPNDTTNFHGKVYGFCNPGCKEEFLKNPEKYTK